MLGNNRNNRKNPIRLAMLDKLKREASHLSEKVRQQVFTLRETKPTSLVDKVRAHRLLERRHAFKQAGGPQSGLARYALNKARRSRS